MQNSKLYKELKTRGLDKLILYMLTLTFTSRYLEKEQITADKLNKNESSSCIDHAKNTSKIRNNNRSVEESPFSGICPARPIHNKANKSAQCI